MDTDRYRSKTDMKRVRSLKNSYPSVSISVHLRLKIFATLHVCAFALIFCSSIEAQRVAILTPDNTDPSRSFAQKLEDSLSKRVRIIDDSLSETAFGSAKPETPFNLTKEDSMRIGAVIGCDYFILLKSATLRRSAYKRPEYYEANAVIYVVSSRTGRLLFWRLQKFEANKPKDADKLLAKSVDPLAIEIAAKLIATTKAEVSEPTPPAVEEVPDAHAPEAKNFKAPVPFRRIKPEYTAIAGFYNIAATVDIVIDLDAAGTITRTEIVRWAGYELDESVEKTVRQMNWRPAERNGKPLPMRFLVRYNFVKVDKE